MARVKREIESNSNSNGPLRELRSKRTRVDSNSRVSADDNNAQTRSKKCNNNQQINGRVHGEDEIAVRRYLRSKYLAVKNLISGEEEDLTLPGSSRFRTIFNEVESLHQQVQKPREQVADAEVLLDIATSFVKSVKAQRNEGVTPSDFVACLLKNFGRQDRATSSTAEGARNSILWKDIGVAVSHIFRKGAGCSTMLGPMNAELKIRKNTVNRKHVRPTETARPEELNNVAEEKTDTDKNMFTMFCLLRKYRRVRLENLVLNRTSFAQTVENLFALSFLVKDGRAEITVNKDGHFVCPRNAPTAEAVTAGSVAYGHFVFRFDFKDWKMMLDSVAEGVELMPHRVQVLDVRANTRVHNGSTDDLAPVESEIAVATKPVRNSSSNLGKSAHFGAPEDSTLQEDETEPTSTPIRKLSRNRGLVLQKQTLVEDSPESDESRARASYIRKGKRKLM